MLYDEEFKVFQSRFFLGGPYGADDPSEDHGDFLSVLRVCWMVIIFSIVFLMGKSRELG